MSQSPDTSARPPRLWRIVLAVSLALNLAVAGLALGAVVKHRHEGTDRSAPRFGPFSDALDHQDRAALRGAFRAALPDFRDERAAIRAELAEVLPILRAEPFDRGALAAAMDRMGQRTAERLAKGQALMLDHIAAMTPEARASFADRLEQALERRGAGDRGDRGDGD